MLKNALVAVCVLLAETSGNALGSGVLVPRDGSPPIRIQSHRVTAEIKDGLARTTVRQTFVNPHGRTLEAVYLFPLPEDGALVGLAMEVGGQRLDGFLAERRTARQAYDTLVRRRIDPALVEQIGRSTFRLSVFPVLPGQPTVVELTWIEPVPLVDGEYRYVYPLALSGEAAVAEQDLTAAITLRSGAPIHSLHSPNEDMVTRMVSRHEARASLELSSARLAEDLILTARVEAPEPSLAAHVFRPGHGAAYFAMVVTPPVLSEEQLVPRDITLALDVSGSMKGVKFEQAQAAGQWLVDHLRSHDRINILLFSDSVQRFQSEPVPATEENRAAGRAFLQAARPGGGTALGDAVRVGCESSSRPGRSAMLVLLTDGIPTVGEMSSERIIAFAREGQVGRGLRTYTFGVGGDVQAALLEGVAAAGGGSAEVFRVHGEVDSRLRRFLTRTASPAIVDLRLTIAGRPVDDVLPRPLPELYRGEQAVLTGRFPGEGMHEVVVEGVLDARKMKLTKTVNFGRAQGVASGEPVARDLFARARLDFLSQAQRLRAGLSDAAYFAALDRGAYSTDDELVAAMIDLSIESGVQCAYTSFLALLPEDHERMHPRDAVALDAALQRANDRQRELAHRIVEGSGPSGEAIDRSFDGAGGEWVVDVPSTASAAGTGPASPPPTSGRAAPGPLAARPMTGGRGFSKKGGGEGFERWEFWWEHNKGALDSLPRNAAPPHRSSIDPAHRDRLLAELLPLLEDPQADLADSAALAVARLPGATEEPAVRDHLIAALRHPSRTVREAATLGLGILGSAAAIPELCELLHDTKEGRHMTGTSGEVEPLVRAFAAASLGMIGHESSTAELMRVLRGPRLHAPLDLQAMAIEALGRMPGPHAPIVALLQEIMNQPGWNRIVRAQAPIALGRLHAQCREHSSGDGCPEVEAALPGLIARLENPATDLDLCRSLVICLGVLGGVGQPEVRCALMEQVDRSRDDQTRHLAIMALAQIGARDPVPAVHASAHASLDRFLWEQLTTPRSPTHSPFGALALGIYYRERLPEQRELMGRQILQQFRQTGHSAARAAMAVALGLLNHREALDELWVEFGRTTDSSLKESIVISVGQMRAEGFVGRMHSLLGAPGLPSRLRLQVATALGRMGDADSARVLTESLMTATTLGEAASAALALGRIQDTQSIEVLRTLATDPARSALQRGLACSALGAMADPAEKPWNVGFAVNCNYRAKVPALSEILDLY